MSDKTFYNKKEIDALMEKTKQELIISCDNSVVIGKNEMEVPDTWNKLIIDVDESKK